jgi:hypothetical protein
MQADIGEISRFLGGYAPAQLEALRQRHPKERAYLEPRGVTLGGGAASDTATDAACAMLDSVDQIASKAIVETIQKLKSARTLELCGSVLALLASGGVIGAVFGFSATTAAAVLAVIGFLANLVPLVTNWLRGTVGGQGSIGESFIKLRELTWDARALRAKFTHLPDGQSSADLIQQANSLARDLYVVLSDLGYQPQFRPV